MLSLKSLMYKAKKKHALNIFGLILAFCLFFFAIWQLDIIVSGPVWWEASPTGEGWSWHGPGAYQRSYFQCFIWRTTIGTAYDVLFMTLFVALILAVLSLWLWNDE